MSEINQAWVCKRCSVGKGIIKDIVLDYNVLDYLQHQTYSTDCTPAEKKRVRSRAKNYAIDKQQLYFKATSRFDQRPVPDVPDRDQIIASLHNLGHYGIQRTANLVQERYYWPGTFNDVSDYINSCSDCRLRSITFTEPAQLKSIPIQDQAFHRVGIDLIGPITETPRGNKYLAVAIDYLTKWGEVAAIPDKKSETVAQFFERDIIARHGCPREVLSDNGTEFKGEFGKLLQKYGIDYVHTSLHHPQTNGLVEHYNCTIFKSLNKSVQDNPQDWDLLLPRVLLGYRATLHATTKISPYFFVYARHPLLPVELAPKTTQPSLVLGTRELQLQNTTEKGTLETPTNPNQASSCKIRESVTKRRRTIEQTTKTTAMANIATAQQKQQRDYSKKRKRTTGESTDPKTEIEAGDFVVIKPAGRQPKIKQPPQILMCIKVGEGDDKGEVLLRDNSDPPKSWWEPKVNVGIYKKASDLSEED